MTMASFINENMWGIIVGVVSLMATVVVIRVTLAQVVRDVSTMAKRLNDHTTRISDLEKYQAERLGYERALRDVRAGEVA